MPRDGLEDETLPGKQEQHRGLQSCLCHVALDMSFRLLGPLFLHLSNRGL